jgi:8-oxo-dGTP diphosphatase / 2-hydroxy-dATP diphosphatase
MVCQKIITTLCLIRQNDKILLGFCKRGLSHSRWNGFGGKVKEGETIEEAATRETREEAGVDIIEMEKIGVNDFSWRGKSDIIQVHIFSCKKFSGQARETEEMRPEWVEIEKVDFSQMWADDEYWYPLFLAGKKFKGEFLFNDNDKVLKHKLAEVVTLS